MTHYDRDLDVAFAPTFWLSKHRRHITKDNRDWVGYKITLLPPYVRFTLFTLTRSSRR
jgi:hypothetical protein